MKTIAKNNRIKAIRYFLPIAFNIIISSAAIFLVLAYGLIIFGLDDGLKKGIQYLSLLPSDYLILVSTAAIIMVIWNYRKVFRTLRANILNTTQVILGVLAILLFFAIKFSYIPPLLSRPLDPVTYFLPVVLLEFVVLKLLSAIFKPKLINAKKSPFISDDPVHLNKELTPSQDVAHASLSDILKSGTPRSIAFTGKWGTGKSLIIEKLKAEVSSDIIWYDFQPWTYTNESSLINGFYIGIAQKIKQSMPGIEANFVLKVSSSFQKFLDKNSSSLVVFIIDTLLKVFGDTDSPEEKISKALKDENKRLIICIDDVERLNNSAMIRRTLQLAQYTKRIANSQMVMVFEKDALMLAKPEHIENPEEYLEKFFEIEIGLPTTQEDSLRQHLAAVLPNSYVPNYISQALIQDIGSHRGAIRLANELISNDIQNSRSTLNSKNDLARLYDHNDLLVMAYLKLKYPIVYNDIDKYRSIYTQPKDGSEEYFGISLLEDRPKTQREHFMTLFEKLQISDESKTTLRNLLKDIFPGVAQGLGESHSRLVEHRLYEDKRLGIRYVLDSYFGMSEDLDVFLKHESMVKKVITTISTQGYSQKDLYKAVNELVAYSVTLEGSNWDNPLLQLSNEITNTSNYAKEIPNVLIALLRSTLEIGVEYDYKKVRLLGQFFYVATTYRHFSNSHLQPILQSLEAVEVKKYSATPTGTFLIYKMEMNSNAQSFKQNLLSTTTTATLDFEALKNLALEQFKKFYLEEGHDIILEMEDSFVRYAQSNWKELASGSNTELDIYKDWMEKSIAEHPVEYLNRYIGVDLNGQYMFRTNVTDYDLFISKSQYEELMGIIEIIEKSSRDLDQEVIDMITFAKEHAPEGLGQDDE